MVLQHMVENMAQEKSRTDAKNVSARLKQPFAGLFERYQDENGYNQSEAVRKLIQQSLMDEEGTMARKMVDLQERIGELETRVERVETMAETDTAERERMGNLEERLGRLEEIEWQTRFESEDE